MRIRDVIDYALARRAALADLFGGRIASMDVCDAHPYLLRAAKYHGEVSKTPCPVCKRGPLTHVTYTYGDELKDASGRVRATADLPALAREYADLRVYVVEVCRECAWNHLVVSYSIGTRKPAPARKPAGRTADQT